MDLIEYQPSDSGVGFNPIAQPDLLPGIKEEEARQRQAQQDYLRMMQMNDRVRLQNAEKSGRELQALAGLSKTLNEQLTKQYKVTQDDIAIGEVYDAITGGMSPEDQQLSDAVIADIDEETELVNAAAAEVEEQTGDIAAGEAVKQDFGQRGRALNSERSALIEANAAYPAFMQAWMDSDAVITINGAQMTVRQALATGDPRTIQAVIAMGRSKFFKDYNIAGASKRNVVQLLGRTVLTTDAQYAGTAARDAAQGKREAGITQLSDSTYAVGAQFDDARAQGTWSTLADQYWRSGLFKTRAEANQALMNDLLKPLVANGDVEAIEALEDVLKTGEKGTELSGQFGEELDRAKNLARQAKDAAETREVKDIVANMYEGLAGVESPEERVAIIERAVKQLRDAGKYQEARELEGQLQGLTIDGNSSYNAAKLLQQIRDDELVNPQDIEEAALRGDITEQQRSTLLQELAQQTSRQAPENPAANRIAKDYTNKFQADLLAAVGLKPTADGISFEPLTEQGSPLSPGDAAVLIGGAREEINKIVNQIVSNNPGASQTQLEDLIRNALNNWYATEVNSEDGKYGAISLLDAAKDDTESNDYPPDAIEALEKLVANPTRLATPFGLPVTQRPQDWSQVELTDLNRNLYNPLRGDTLFKTDRMQEFVDLYEEGKFHPQLIRYADTLGVTPLALMQQQLSALNMEPMKAPAISRTVDASNITVSNVTTSLEGATVFMQLGVPSRGAAWLAGNIQQESSWSGQRTWDDLGTTAGGLVSWQTPRLRAMEQEFGRPVTQITDVEQMQYMLQEMKDQYPEAYEIFMNPNATERQLMRASELFWGYGEEGNRFTYAREVEPLLPDSAPSAVRLPESSSETGTNTGIIITSEIDKTGEPGSDFVISNGQRGAKFYFPYTAEVLRIVDNQDWETHLEKGPGRRGYGNLVELRVTLPNGMKADVLIAHFDLVNGKLRVGMTLPANSYIGTQGRKGSTTAAHISMDWFQPDGTPTPNLPARDWFLNNYLRQ